MARKPDSFPVLTPLGRLRNGVENVVQIKGGQFGGVGIHDLSKLMTQLVCV